MVRVAINGFGRIGRLVLRVGLNDPKLEFVAVNDLSTKDLKAYLFKYDSVHGRFNGKVSVSNDALIVNGKKIRLLSEKNPENLPWKELKVDVVAECTGIFRTKKKAEMHLKAGAKKVLISAPCKCDDESPKMAKTIVMGVNDSAYDKKSDHVISNASCTTNCLAPMAKVLNDNFGIEKAFFVTAHAYTASQNLVDGANKNLRSARASAVNIVPHSSGAVIAMEHALPELKGKVTGYALRVPVPDGSITDLTAVLKKKVTPEEVNKAFEKASKKQMKGILEYSEDEIVSTDIIGNPHSVVFDSALTKVIKGNLVKVAGWYDNEYGFSVRMVDLIKKMI